MGDHAKRPLETAANLRRGTSSWLSGRIVSRTGAVLGGGSES